MALQIFTGISGESQMQMDLLLYLLTDLNVHANCDFDAGVKGAFICILFSVKMTTKRIYFYVVFFFSMNSTLYFKYRT